MSLKKTQKVNWMDMFPDEFYDAQNYCPVCYMAYGLAEPHGTYNALGIDWYNAQSLLEFAAKKHGGIVAPPFAWHIQEQPYYDWEMDCCGMGMSLSSSITEELFLHNILHHIRNIDGKGFHAGILVSGHNVSDLDKDMNLLCEFYRRRTGSPVQLRAVYSTDLVDDLGPEYDSHHAGITETCEFMVYKPELVDLGRLNKPLNVPIKIAGENERFDTYCAPKNFGRDGRLPSSELGWILIDKKVKRLGEIKNELLGRYEPVNDWKAPSIIDTEELWARFVFITKRYWNCLLTKEEAKKGMSHEFPGWDALGE